MILAVPKHMAVMPWLKQRWAALEADTEAKMAAAAARDKEDEVRRLLRVPISLPANGHLVASLSGTEAAEKSSAGKAATRAQTCVSCHK
jgi:hypothetical protein